MSNDSHLLEYDRNRERMAFTTRDFVSILFKHQRVILTSFVVVAVLTALGVWSLPQTYVAEGKVLVKTEQQGNPSFFSGIAAYREPRESDPVNRKIETEMEQLSTRYLSESVVQKLGLTYDQVYHKPLTHYMRPLTDVYDWVLEKVFGYPQDEDKYGFKGVVKAFNKSFTVAPLRSKSADTTSNMILLSLKATDPSVARQALQTLLEEYINLTMEQNRKLAMEAYALVERNMQEAEAALDAAREQERAFVAESGAMLSSRFGGASRGDGGADNRGKFSGLSKAGEQSTIGALRSHLIDMELQMIELRNVFTDSSESVRLQERSIAELKRRIDMELRQTAENEKALAALELNVRAAEAHYIDLRRKLDQIALYLQLNPAEAGSRTISEPPLQPKSSEWKKSLLVTVFGTLAGLLLGLGMAGYREYADHRLSTPEELEHYLGLKALMVIPMQEEAELRQSLAETVGFPGRSES